MTIAILEDNDDRQAIMRSILADQFPMHDIQIYDAAAVMVGFLEEHLADTQVISLDHDLELKPGPHGRCIDPGTGREVADYLATQLPVCPVIIHTTNSQAALGMELVLKDAHWKTRRVVPFDDMQWIETAWFPALRRAIVGPIQKKVPPNK